MLQNQIRKFSKWVHKFIIAGADLHSKLKKEIKKKENKPWKNPIQITLDD